MIQASEIAIPETRCIFRTIDTDEEEAYEQATAAKQGFAFRRDSQTNKKPYGLCSL